VLDDDEQVESKPAEKLQVDPSKFKEQGN